MVDELFEMVEDLFDRKKKKKKGKGKHDDEYYEDEAATESPEPTATVFCVECGQKNDAEARFCRECGEILPSAGEEPQCPQCRTTVPLTAKFCSQCGTTLRAGR